MKIAWVFIVTFLSVSAFAETSEECLELKSEQIRLALTGSNLANANSTRTPEGGPFRPHIIKSCSSGGCDAKRDDRAPLMKYLPDHPDADKNGYVAYPNIDSKKEYAAFNMSVAKLRVLASVESCNSKIKDYRSSALIQYSKGVGDVKEDVFNFDSRNQVVSWSRSDWGGVSTSFNFYPDGKALAIEDVQSSDEPSKMNSKKALDL